MRADTLPAIPADMDEDLQRLLREAEAHPTDEGLARRVDHALRRAGRDDERRARFRFKFQCPLRFEDLQPSPVDPLERACDRCHRQVRFVASVEQLAEQVAQGRCVAFERKALGDVVEWVFGDLWWRPGLTRRDRRLISITCVALTGAPFPLAIHVGAAVWSGDVSAAEMPGIASVIRPYCSRARAEALTDAVAQATAAP